MSGYEADYTVRMTDSKFHFISETHALTWTGLTRFSENAEPAAVMLYCTNLNLRVFFHCITFASSKKYYKVVTARSFINLN